MQENKMNIEAESRNYMKVNQVLKDVEKHENSFKELYLKKILHKNDRDLEKNKVFEGFQIRINELNKNPLKQQLNEYLKKKKELELAIHNSMKNV